jgi:N-ethylmaleimide reductase
MTSQKLLDRFSLRDLELPNRIVLAPMTRARAGIDRIPNALMAEYYVQRWDAGLILSEATSISVGGLGWNETPGIYSDAMTAGWKQVVDAIHAAKGRIFMQLWHCGRASHSSFHHGEPSVAPSAIKINEESIHTPTGKQPHEVPRSTETEEIAVIVEEYRLAARRARMAGFDGIEIHAANGYLIDTFLQSKTNLRTDRYGGSIENRFRFLDEVIQAVESEWPTNRIGVRISPNGVFNDMGSTDYREQFLYVAKELNRRSLSYLHVMDGLAFGFHNHGSPMTLKEFRSVFDGPLMGNCGYTCEAANEVIAAGDADLISIGRPFISNPDLVNRYRNGWPLAEDAPMDVWYQPTGSQGYTDFPAYESSGQWWNRLKFIT